MKNITKKSGRKKPKKGETEVVMEKPKGIPTRIFLKGYNLQEETLINDEGGYGLIWQVRDKNTGKTYALKKMYCTVNLHIMLNLINVYRVSSHIRLLRRSLRFIDPCPSTRIL